MTHRLFWLLSCVCCAWLAGCQGTTRYTEHDYIELEWEDENHVLVDFEQVLANGTTAGYVKSMYHREMNKTDFYVYGPNLRQVGYVRGDGATYQYSRRFEKLMYRGHFNLQGSVKLLLNVEKQYYIVPVTSSKTWKELEAMQPGAGEGVEFVGEDD